MLNLHPPFRLATPDDGSALADLLGGGVTPTVVGPHIVVAEEGGRVVAALSGHEAGDAWRIDLFIVAPVHRAELGPRLLAVADALAADEGLAIVAISGACEEAFLAFLDGEGFRPGGGGDLAREVIPQG